jgi:uncharacterized protein YycO
MVEIGDVVFVKQKGIIADLISKITKSPFNHVAMYVGNGKIIEANGFIRTRVVPLETYNGEYEIYRIPRLAEYQKRRIVDYALTKVGTKYDYAKILGLFIRFEFLKRFKGFEERNHFICSELIDRSLQAGDVPRKGMDFFGDISPSELFKYYNFERVNERG